MTGPTWQGSVPAGTGAPYGSGQPPPPGYGMAPEQATPGPPSGSGEKPAAELLGKGLFGSLFDRSFDNLVTIKLLRLLYTLAMVCVTGFNLVLFMFGWSMAAGTFWPFLGWTMVVGVPVLWLAELVLVRVVVEYLIVQHKISTDLAIIREVIKDIRAAKS